MKICIDDEICKKNGLDAATVLQMLVVKCGVNPYQLLETMLSNEMIGKTLDGEYLMSQRWDDVCSNIILTSDDSVPNDNRIENLAKQLMEIFPKGKKEGTNTYWRGNLKDTMLRLKKFFKLYGNRFSDEEILDAAKRYVEAFNGNYSYMRILKYFIWKVVRKVDSEGNGFAEEVSDLATIIENRDDCINTDWVSELR